MKCNKCGEEWTNPPGKTFKFCPNCTAPISPQADKSSGNIIKALVEQHGEDILHSPNRLLSFAADYLKGENDHLLKNLKWAMTEDVPQKLLAIKNADEHIRNLRLNVILEGLDEAGMKKELAAELVGYFAEALGIELQNALTQAANKNTAKAAIATHVTLANEGNEISGSGASSGGNGRIQLEPVVKISDIMPFAGRDWRVLNIQDGKALLLSDRIVEERWYHTKFVAITWAECELNHYLNDTFFNSLGQDKSRIADTRVITNNNPWYGTKGGSAVNNKIFLLSIEEVVKYFGDSGQLINRPSKDFNINDQYNDIRIAFDKEGKACWWWWLRSPGHNPDAAADVMGVGSLGLHGSNVFGIGPGGGVRPALWLHL